MFKPLPGIEFKAKVDNDLKIMEEKINALS